MIKIAGLVLIVVGALALAYQGFTYNETKQDAQIGVNSVCRKMVSVPFPCVSSDATM